MQIDAVYPYCESTSYWKQELRFSLRSLCKYFSELGSVYLVGERLPSWSKDLNLIPGAGWVGGAANRNRLIAEKLVAACHAKEVSDPFLYMCDDFYLNQRMLSPDGLRNYALSDLTEAEIPKRLNKGWWSVFWQTVRVLRGNTQRIYNYETHVPKLVYKNFFLETMLKYGTVYGYNWETLYFNHFHDGKVADLHDGWVVGFSKQLTHMEILAIILTPQTCFINHNDAGLNDDMIEILRQTFPVKSRFER